MRRLWGWGVAAGAAAAVAVVSAAARSLPGVAASVVAAVAVAVGGVWSARANQVLAAEPDRTRRSRELFTGSAGRLPRVRELTDPVLAGVHPAAVAIAPVPGRVPPFVRRDRSDQLEAALRAGSSVLLVGDSAAGKSRAAFEAMRACLPEYVFIRPAGRAAVPVMLEAARRERRSVLWLDDLERYLGAGGLTAGQLAALLADGKRQVVVLATMRAQERARFSPRNSLGSDPGAAEVARSGLEVLEMATEIRLERTWTPPELDRARQLAGDERISAALKHADRFGLAEFIAAGPQLLADWRDGWAPGTHPRGAAVVATAVDALRAGYRGPLPGSLLRELHEHYLRARGGAALRPEGWEEALGWATEPLQATSSLLSRDEEGRYEAFGYLPDAVDSSPDPVPVPDVTWRTLIGAADLHQADDIGWAAYSCASWAHARDAFRKAVDGGYWPAAIGLSACAGEVFGSAQEAAEILRSAIAAAEASDGHERMGLLRLRANLSWWTGQGGNPESAFALARDVLAESTRVLGPDHPDTLHRRLSVARWTGEAGDPATALQLAHAAAADCATTLGPAHPQTLNARFETALWTGKAGDATGAVQLFRALDTDLGSVQDADLSYLVDVRTNLAVWLVTSGDFADSIGLVRRNADDAAKTLGEEHVSTLMAQQMLARATGLTGNTAEALRIAEHALAGCQRYGASSLLTLNCRYEQALWTGQSGNLTEAIRQFETLTGDVAHLRGPHHPIVLDSRCRLAELADRNGDRKRAVQLWQDLLTDYTDIAGPDHPTSQEIRTELQRQQHGSAPATGA